MPRGKYVEPSTTLTAFSCPYCGTLTSQNWFNGCGSPAEHAPCLSSAPWIRERLGEDFEGPEIPAETLGFLKDCLDKVESRKILVETDSWINARGIQNIDFSMCRECKQVAIWHAGEILWPGHREEFEANEDIPDDARRDFEEAARILAFSPRSSCAMLRLCLQRITVSLGYGDNLNDAIKKMVDAGLDSHVQKALDVVRVVGNEAVHPGTLNLNDDRETASVIFQMINIIGEFFFTRPESIRRAFSSLPAEKIEAIKKRDGNA